MFLLSLSMGDKYSQTRTEIFSEDRILSSGYNVITIVAKDKFGKETEKTLHITYKS